MKITDQAFENKEITLEHLNTFDMVADILTKPLGPTDFIGCGEFYWEWIL